MKAEQRALQFSCNGHSLVGILDVPERPLPRGVLVVSAGPQYRVGSHRQYTLMARLLAPRGIAVMRFDCRGTGDSEGDAPALPLPAIDADISGAIDEFFRQMPELNEVVIWALGDGASAAALYAHTDPRVRGLVLLNPWPGADASTQSALLPQLLARFGEIGFWKKTGTRHAHAVEANLPLPQRIIAALACLDGAALLIVASEDRIGRQFASLMAEHQATCRQITIAGANHTFASRAWRDEVAELSANWIASW
ncbi:hydrolase 1, exosortase A system-associated [Massilia sp. CF038]|uniref:hydrolase 1, exosortase A system-associated n=1 Tax=Massilia sp. CF038 TaxID=1881045 RepID=UPI000916C2F6|nr:hydrolase 1, exosortase A system-associated [Massilia sp. CF038]SHG74804.1 exosortase A system-associated hydrolase 1 [Massilia sp. CF038]